MTPQFLKTELRQTYHFMKPLPWWKLFNKELVSRGLPEADFKTAHGYYELCFTPKAAADDELANREAGY
jgi:hypothetical protein